MDYKQKYEDAIERCKQEFNFSNLACSHEEIKQKLERIFPELKESEDEKIRKSILEEFKVKAIGGYEEKFFRNGVKIKDAIDWLEKQNEQKPADKVEPKFKVGDWIVRNYQNSGMVINRVVDIRRINDETYGYDLSDGTYFSGSFEREYHLWTIQDAKDGDILVTRISPEGDWIGIYKQSTGDMFKTHCYLNTVGEFVINPNRCKNHGTHGLHPATKEQRDLLFQKMKEAGYEWDADKKELKKIEKKPNFCHHEVDLSNCSEEYRKAYYDGWNNCNQQHSQLKAERKPAWSEEDDEMFDNVIQTEKDCINYCDVDGIGTKARFCYEKEIEWLKSLKQRMKGE